MPSSTSSSEVRFTQPGPDSGDQLSLDEQGRWLWFVEKAEAAKGKGEISDPSALADLALQHAEDQVDFAAGITPPQAK